MDNKNILIIIDELGSLLGKYKDEIKYKDFQIEHLRNKIESIENYIAFYSEDTVTDEDYKEVKRIAGG